MSDRQLMTQFRRCLKWNDAKQWELLAIAYLQRGYSLNARKCYEHADLCREVKR